MNGGAEHRAGVDASAGRGVQAGDHGTQVNSFSGDQPEVAASGGRDGFAAGRDLTVNNYPVGKPEPEPLVVTGDIPQEPAAFQSRAGLAEVLGRQGGGRVRVVFAVTGVRGVGKTQVAAAVARRRIAERWRLVAWVDASDEASLLAGLRGRRRRTRGWGSWRMRSVSLLHTLGDSTELAVLAAEPLVADCERLLGADHPDTLTSRNNLAVAYQAAGRTAKAIGLHERTLADYERLLGAEHPNLRSALA